MKRAAHQIYGKKIKKKVPYFSKECNNLEFKELYHMVFKYLQCEDLKNILLVSKNFYKIGCPFIHDIIKNINYIIFNGDIISKKFEFYIFDRITFCDIYTFEKAMFYIKKYIKNYIKKKINKCSFVTTFKTCDILFNIKLFDHVTKPNAFKTIGFVRTALIYDEICFFDEIKNQKNNFEIIFIDGEIKISHFY